MKKHILIIDDEADIREMLSAFLTAKGYRASTAESSEAARRTVKIDPPHLIITDLQMPDTDALELAGELRKSVPGSPVLLLTGVFFDQEVIDTNAGKRFDSYLSKTSSLQRIVQEIRYLLGEEPARDQTG